MKELSTDDSYNWERKDVTGYDVDAYLGIDKCANLDKELWIKLGNCMWRKHQSVYQDHLIYICNNILKPFRVEILRYAEQVQEMHDLAKHLHTLSLKGESYEADNWKVHDKTLYVDGI